MSQSRFSLLAMAVPLLGGALVFSTAPVQPAHAQSPGEMIAAGIVGGIVGAFASGGHNYCFYDNGWNGPGWYWCGDYAYQYGAGWGGPVGWNNWSWRGGFAPGYRHGWHGTPPRGWSGKPGHWNRPNAAARPGVGHAGRPGGRPSAGAHRPGPRPGAARPGGARPKAARPAGGGHSKGGHHR